MKVWTAAVTAALVAAPTLAFQAPFAKGVVHRQGSLLFADPEELREYMVKAHEDKLKAVKQIEEKKNGEIESLKKELQALKSAPGALATTSAPPIPAGLDVSQMTKEQLAHKLLSYQQFMAKYIVDAQQQKIKAIAAAENKIKQQYKEKLRLWSGSPGVTVPASSASPAASPAFEQRSAKVSAAAAAGKSRWGDLENEKAGKVAGVVNGVMKVNGSTAPPILLPTPPTAESTILFDKRNARVAAAGKAGKSRWGDWEVTKASTAATLLPSAPASAPATASSPAPASLPSVDAVPAEVIAADHGLRADGGVGGPSLAERVNFGAQLVNGPITASVPAPLGNTLAPATYYEQRNARVAAAAVAGKSRWGERETERAQSLSASLSFRGSSSSSSNSNSNSASPTVNITPEIEAADHGLRADGGVGGPSLAQRVNFGAALLGQ